MNNTIFSKSFIFASIIHNNPHTTDARNGNKLHFLAYMRKGTAKLVDSNGTINIDEGDVFYIPSNTPYQSHWAKNSPTLHDSIGFTFFPNPKNMSFPMQKIENPPKRVFELFDAIEKNKPADLKSVSILYELMNELFPFMQTTQKTKAEIVVDNAENFMNDNLNFSMADVARHCSVSESVLYSVFKKVRGETPVSVKHKILVEKAINILSSSDYTVEYISQELGFSSATYFRKIFTEVTGKRPKDYRTYHGF